jgi:hypothetical protein
MTDLPSMQTSRLWMRLSEHVRLQQSLLRVREVVEALASKIAEVLPEYTDHSIRHLDKAS